MARAAGGSGRLAPRQIRRRLGGARRPLRRGPPPARAVRSLLRAGRRASHPSRRTPRAATVGPRDHRRIEGNSEGTRGRAQARLEQQVGDEYRAALQTLQARECTAASLLVVGPTAFSPAAIAAEAPVAPVGGGRLAADRRGHHRRAGPGPRPTSKAIIGVSAPRGNRGGKQGRGPAARAAAGLQETSTLAGPDSSDENCAAGGRQRHASFQRLGPSGPLPDSDGSDGGSPRSSAVSAKRQRATGAPWAGGALVSAMREAPSG